jgi:hypothetical protein
MGRRLLVGLVGVTVIASGAGCAGSAVRHAQPTGATAEDVVDEGPKPPPTTSEVEEDTRADARREGRLRHVSCRELQGHHWSCLLRFANGALVLEQIVWYGHAQSLGVSVVAREGRVELNRR